MPVGSFAEGGESEARKVVQVHIPRLSMRGCMDVMGQWKMVMRKENIMMK